MTDLIAVTRTRFLTAALLLGAVYLWCCEHRFVEVHVVDETSSPVAGARVTVGFFMPRTGLGATIKGSSGFTGKSGVFSIRRGGVNISGVLVEKEGYYPSRIGFGGTVDVHRFVLKKIGNPVPLCVRSVVLSKPPEIGKPVAFDFEIGDWLPPYGEGKRSDIIFVREGSYAEDMNDFDVTISVRFSEPDDGFVETFADNSGSDLRLPRMAPEGTYMTHLVRRQRPGASNFDTSRAYFLRLRSSRDSAGVVAGNFAKIVGDMDLPPDGRIRFQYYFNPVRGSRNLEFDRSRNLTTWGQTGAFLNLP